MKKRYVLGAIVLVGALSVVLFTFFQSEPEPVVEEEPVVEVERPRVVGQSVEGRDIEVYTYGSGDTHLLFVGGIHGGYEWNSVLLSYELIDYLEETQSALPEGVTVSVIPSLNPDGVYAVIGVEGRFSPSDTPSVAETIPGRFNANNVDLNRNFDCKWQPEAQWRGEVTSAGTAAFSEPEARVLRDYVLETRPDAALFYHSQADAVYASECEEGVLPETLTILNLYSDATGYTAVESFDAYPVTGDVEGWLASIGIPALTVELKTHEVIEWERNKAGIEALLRYFAETE